MRTLKLAAVGAVVSLLFILPGSALAAKGTGLWKVYNQTLSKARYIDLTHDITPNMPVWKGFGPATFKPVGRPDHGPARTRTRRTASRPPPTRSRPTSSAPSSTRRRTGRPSTRAIDELPPTFAVRPLVVISIVKQVKTDPKYALQVSDIKTFEKKNGKIPEGSVVMVRSDWSKKWTDDPVAAKALAADPVFPGVSLKALKFLHLKRHILFHGHEPLDTDTTPTLEGEAWLMHHGYTQAEGVANLEGVPGHRLPASTSATRSSGAASAATLATSRSARRRRRRARRSRARTRRCPSTARRCTGTTRSATGCAEDRRARGRRAAPPARWTAGPGRPRSL